MANTRSISSASKPLTLKQKADLIREQRKGGVAPERKDASFFESLGFMAADAINGFGTIGDAYTVRRAERQ